MNSTDDSPNFAERLDTSLIVVIAVFIMLSMGCVTELPNIRDNLRRPWGMLLTLLTQFVIMPLVAFILIITTDLPTVYAIGAIIVASCPGGAFSNTFSYFSFGDVPLSICLTTCSSLFAVAGLPLTVAIYSNALIPENSEIIVPYTQICVSLLMVILPTIAGILILWKCPRLAIILEKTCCVIGLLALAAWLIQKCVFTSEIFAAPWQAYAIGAALPVISFAVGFTLSTACRLPADKRRSVAIETGCQNVGLALAIIAISFSGFPYSLQIQGVPLFYCIAMFMYAFVGIVACRVLYGDRREEEKKRLEEMNANKDGGESLIGDKTDEELDYTNSMTYGSVKDDSLDPIRGVEQ